MENTNGGPVGGDRRLTMVTWLLGLSVITNLLFWTDLPHRLQPMPIKVDDNALVAELSAAQISLLGQRVASLEASLELQIANTARVQGPADSRATQVANLNSQIANLNSLIELNKVARDAALLEREFRARSLVLRASARIGERLTEDAIRNVTSMFGESVPGWGIPVIVATTSLEIKGA